MAGAVGALVIRSRPVFLLLLVLGVVHDVSAQSGTTPGIRDIFIGRCEDFQNQRPAVFKNNRKNCTLLWEVFLNSFANKDSCAVNASSYKSFLSEANHTAAIKDQAMFWAYVKPFVYRYTELLQGQYLAIIDLLSGYTLNELSWCWNSSKNALDYTSCPSYKNCPYENEAVRSFWKANSEMFAGLAIGKVFAMLNGSTEGGAYTNRSFFYTVEVPAMNSSRIKTMEVILVHNLGKPFSEDCTNGTLKELEIQITEKGIDFQCTMDDPNVKHLQCLMYPQYAEYCSTVNGAPSATSYLASVTIVLWIARFLYYAEM